MVPEVAVDGTDVVIVVAVLEVTVASTPLNFTILLAAVGLKFAPVIVTTEEPTDAPTPFDGSKLRITGGGVTESFEQEENCMQPRMRSANAHNDLIIVLGLGEMETSI